MTALTQVQQAAVGVEFGATGIGQQDRNRGGQGQV